MITAFSGSPWHAGQRHEQIGFEAALGRGTQDVEAVANLGFLQIAEIGVEALQIAVFIAGEARVEIKPVAAGQIENVFLQGRKPAPVEAGGEIVFVDEGFEILQWPIGFGARKRWRQVIDDHGTGAALGLRAFAGIVDDEGIELRQGSQGDFGIAFRRQRVGLAG